MNISNIIDLFKNFNSHTDDYLGAMYMSIYHQLPQCYRIYYGNDDELHYQHSSELFFDIRKEMKSKIDCRALLQNLQKIEKKYELEIFCYSAHEYLILGGFSEYLHYGESCKFPYNFLMNITLSQDSEMADFYEEVFCQAEDIEPIMEMLKKNCVKSSKKDKIEFGIAAIDASNNIYTSWYDYEDKNIDVEKNYNDDFPYKKICDLIENENSSELILFYGEPGTGKTSVIKHLISKYDEMDFVFIDGGILAGVSQEKLMSYFLDNQNTVFILEDCEKALVDREHNFNPVMPVLLNITDGIIGDVLGIKLICTFNTALSKIDQALLRKGRLSLKYEFKKLAKEKCRKITGDMSIDKDMTLADLYNKDEENDFSKKNQKKIGF